jgi:Arc-like DNA binding domain
MKGMAKLTAHLRLRMPEELRKRLSEEAEESGRSLNSEILWRLGQTFDQAVQEFIADREEADKREREMFDQMMQDPEQRKRLLEIVAKMPKKEKR